MREFRISFPRLKTNKNIFASILLRFFSFSFFFSFFKNLYGKNCVRKMNIKSVISCYIWSRRKKVRTMVIGIKTEVLFNWLILCMHFLQMFDYSMHHRNDEIIFTTLKSSKLYKRGGGAENQNIYLFFHFIYLLLKIVTIL